MSKPQSPRKGRETLRRNKGGRLCGEIKLKNADQIRASVIVKWLKQYNLREVQYLAGHRYISSTEAYRQSEMQELTEEVNKYHPLG